MILLGVDTFFRYWTKCDIVLVLVIFTIFMQTFFSNDILMYLNDLFGFLLTLIGISTMFLYGLVALYNMFKPSKRWEEIRKAFGKRLLVGMEFVIAAQVIAAVTVSTPNTLGTLIVLVLARFMLGYTLQREMK